MHPRSPPTGQMYPNVEAVPTDYFCKRCQCMKMRCAGCGKIICYCEKSNGHIVSDDYHICLPAPS